MKRLVARRTETAFAPSPVSGNTRSTAPIDSVLTPLSQRYILVYPALQAVTGSAKAALMLSQMLYWTRTYLTSRPERGGWFWHTQQDWRSSTGLSRHEQDHARSVLLATGFVEERRMGALGRMHFRVDLEALGQAITRRSQQRPPQWRWDEAAMKALLGRPVAFLRGLVDVCGSFTAAFYLSDLCQQQRTIERNALHGYIPLNSAQREIDTAAGWLDLPLGETANRLGLTSRRLRLARQTLVAVGLVEECSSGGVQPRTLSRVNLQALTDTLAKLQKASQTQAIAINKPAPTLEDRRCQKAGVDGSNQQVLDFTGMAETYIPEVTKPANRNGGNVHSRGDETGKLEVTKAAIKNAGFVTSIKVVSTHTEPLELQLLAASGQPKRLQRPRSSGLSDTHVKPGTCLLAGNTDQPIDDAALFLPEQLTAGEVSAARRILSSLPGTVSQQEVADEWAGQLSLGKVQNPLGYLFGLAKRAHHGNFVPAMALQEAQRRERRRRNERALAHARDPATLALPPAGPRATTNRLDASCRRGVPSFFMDQIKELGLGLRRNEWQE